jgi:actin-related protein
MALVVDVGSCYTKAGFAGEDAPKCILPSVVPMGPPLSEMEVEGAAPKPLEVLF